MTKKNHVENYVKEAKQRASPLLQNIFRLSHIFQCLQPSIVDCPFLFIKQVADVLSLYIIFYSVHIGDTERCRYVHATWFWCGRLA